MVEESPSNAEALAARAQVHNKLEDYMEAVADASAAAELDPKLAAAWREKGCASPRGAGGSPSPILQSRDAACPTY